MPLRSVGIVQLWPIGSGERDMRWAALLAIAVGCGSAAGACAQSATAARQLKDAAFATHTDGAVAWQSGEVRLSPGRDQTSVVSLRIKVGEALRPPTLILSLIHI